MILDAIVWDVDPVMIDSFVSIRWYGLMFGIGFLVGYKIVEKMFKSESVPDDWIDKLLLWVLGATVIGARLGHVFFYAWDQYKDDPIKILYVWEGGLASHGLSPLSLPCSYSLLSQPSVHRCGLSTGW